ncbi:hypothetical protein ACRQ84_06220 [Enterobacter ludwigii]
MPVITLTSFRDEDMYPISPLAALFLQVFGCGCLIYLVWQAVINPKLAFKNAAYFVYLIGVMFGCAIVAAKLFPGEFAFIRGAAIGVAIIVLVKWIKEKMEKIEND